MKKVPSKIPLTLHWPGSALIAIWLCGCAPTLERHPGAAPASFAALRAHVEEVRQLRFTKLVKFAIQSRGHFTGFFNPRAQTEKVGKRTEDIGLAYAKLGFLPLGTDLRNAALNYYSSNALAFYDADRQTVFYLKGSVERAERAIFEPEDYKIIIHELTHALQDQKFSLAARLRAAPSTDAVLALRSLAEGDALLTEHAYAFGGLSPWLLSYLEQRLASETGAYMPPHVPALLAERISFQYRAGPNSLLGRSD